MGKIFSNKKNINVLNNKSIFLIILLAIMMKRNFKLHPYFLGIQYFFLST
jgi:hypothetical protein